MRTSYLIATMRFFNHDIGTAWFSFSCMLLYVFKKILLILFYRYTIVVATFDYGFNSSFLAMKRVKCKHAFFLNSAIV